MDMLRPEHINNIPMLTDQMKTQYRNGLTKLWSVMESNPKDSEPHQQAVSKIKQVSHEVMRQIANFKKNASNAQRPGSQGQPRPNPQQQSQSQAQVPQQQQPQQPSQPQQSSQQTQQSQQQPGGPQQSQPGQQPQIQLSAGAKNYLQNFKIFPPANVQPNTPEFEAYKARTLRMLSQAIMAQESSVTRYQSFNEKITQLETNGQDVPTELNQAREQAKGLVQNAKAKGDQMRSENEKNRAYWLAKSKANNAGAQQQPLAVPQNAGDTASPHPNNAQNQLPNQGQGQTHMQQQSQQQPQQPPPAQTQMRQPPMNNGTPMYATNPAIENAQNQNARPPMSPAMPNNFQQGQNQSAAGMQHGQQGGGQMPQQQQQQPNSAAPRPAPMPQQHPFQSPSTQVGQTPTQGPPQPLTHQAAINQANRSYSQQHIQAQQQQQQQQGTPTAAENQNFGQMPNQNPMSVNQKFPIPKHLNVPPVTPVPMGPARPTFGGPSNGAPGMMGQPAMSKHPGFILEGEGDRVLSKKKLDELVRQVTGGGEGDGLTPDVEEVCCNPSLLNGLFIQSSLLHFPTCTSHPPQ